MKKILLLSNMYPSKRYPHYGIFVENCANTLRKEGFEVEVIAITKQDLIWKKVFSYLKFYSSAFIRGIFHKYDCIYAHYASHMMPIVRLLKLVCKEKKIVVNVHGNDIVPISACDRKNPARSQITLNYCDYVIAPSAYFKKVLMEEYHVPEDKIQITPSGGIREDYFYPQNKTVIRKSLEIEEGACMIGYVSRLEPGKGWDTFIRSIALLRKEGYMVHYLMIGEGTDGKSCADLINELELGNCGKVYPFVNQQRLGEFYNAMDVFCFPSRQESLGLVGIEAMACGVPCVLSKTSGILSYAKDGWNCLTFMFESDQELAEKIKSIIEMDQEDRLKMQRNGLTTAEQYYSQNVKENFLTFFKKITEEMA